MAFNWKTFNTRAFTALVFVAVMMAGLLLNHWSFFVYIFRDPLWLLVGILQTHGKKLPD